VSITELTALRFVPIAAEHLPAIVAIEREAYPEPWTEGMFREEIRNSNSRFYVVMQGDEVVGYGGFWPVLDEAHITSVTIRDNLRGLGYGRRLLEFLLDVAASNGAKSATLEVRVSNERARRLYESLGFRQVGLRRRYYPKSNEDAVLMTKLLN
jgi:ribosomal-protein-alanine N-acetyltransferase